MRTNPFSRPDTPSSVLKLRPRIYQSFVQLPITHFLFVVSLSQSRLFLGFPPIAIGIPVSILLASVYGYVTLSLTDKDSLVRSLDLFQGVLSVIIGFVPKFCSFRIYTSLEITG